MDSWLELLRQPLERDLRGVRLVIADGHAGLASAVWQQLPEAQLQRCTVHSTRNVFAKAPWRLRGRLGKDTTDVVEAPSPLGRQEAPGGAPGRPGATGPRGHGVSREGFAAATRSFSFPWAHWKRLRSTKGLDLLLGKVERRIRAAGAVLDRVSALRLVTSVARQVTRVWDDRRYHDRPLLRSNTDTHS